MTCNSLTHEEMDSQLLKIQKFLSFHNLKYKKLRKATALDIRFPCSRSSLICKECAAEYNGATLDAVK
jgi:hypothetical protein